MKSRVVFVLSLSVLMILGLLEGCSSVIDNAPSSKSVRTQNTANTVKIYIPVISKGFQLQFWQSVKYGADQAAKQYNVDITFEGPDTEAQVDRQVEMLQTELDKNPKAICLACIDRKAMSSLLEKAKSKKIPVIGFDSGVDSDILTATVGTNNLKASSLEADKMAELIGGTGEIACVIHDLTSQTGVDRRDGFVNEIKSKYPGIKIVDIQYSNGDVLKSTDLAKAIIQEHPNLKGIFSSNEGSADGVINAVKELNKVGKIIIMGYDSGKQQLDAIKSGAEAGAITQDPIDIGFKSVEAAVKAIKGEKIVKNIDTEFKYYDKTNIDTNEIKALLYN